MIERILLQNFKAVGDPPLDIRLAPLTLLVGANGTGKTSVLEAIAVLADTAGDRGRVGLVTTGPRVAFESADLVFHRRDTSAPLRIQATLRTKRDGPVTYGFRMLRRPGSGVVWDVAQSLSLGDDSDGDSQPIATISRATENNASSRMVLSFPAAHWNSSPVSRDRIAQPNSFEANEVPPDAVVTTRAEVHRADRLMAELSETLAASVAYLSGLRGADLWVKEVGPAVVRTGRYGEQTIRMMSIAQADPKRRRARDRIVEWARRFGMPDLTGGWVADNELVLSFLDPQTATQLPLTSAGSGSQRILPLLVDAFAREGPVTVLIDEIEEAAHPDWQILIAELLAEIVTTGNQVVATTHSPTMVLAVCAAIAKGLMKPEDVALYGLDRGENGATAARLPITRTGWIEGGWIETFARVERDLLGSFLLGEHKYKDEIAGTPQGRLGRYRRERVSESPPDTKPPATRRTRPAKRGRASRR